MQCFWSKDVPNWRPLDGSTRVWCDCHPPNREAVLFFEQCAAIDRPTALVQMSLRWAKRKTRATGTAYRGPRHFARAMEAPVFSHRSTCSDLVPSARLCRDFGGAASSIVHRLDPDAPPAPPGSRGGVSETHEASGVFHTSQQHATEASRNRQACACIIGQMS